MGRQRQGTVGPAARSARNRRYIEPTLIRPLRRRRLGPRHGKVPGSPDPAVRFSRPSTLLCAFLTLLNDRLGESILFPLLPFLLAGFTTDGRVLGLLAGSYAMAQFAFTPLIGALSDRYGRKPVITVCVAGSVLGLGLFALTFSLPWGRLWPGAAASGLPLALLFAARLIDGVSGGTAATAGAVLADISPPEGRAKAFGLFGVSFGLAFILGPGLGGAGRDQPHPAAAVGGGVRPAQPGGGDHPAAGNPPAQRPPAPAPAQGSAALRPSCRCSPIPGCAGSALAFFLFFPGFNGFTALLVLYFKQAFGWGPTSSAMAFSGGGGGGHAGAGSPDRSAGGAAGGMAADPGRPGLRHRRLPAGAPGGHGSNAVPLVFIAVAILALGTGLVTPCLRGLVSRRLEGGGQGAALGSLQALQSLASFMGPPLGGLAFETSAAGVPSCWGSCCWRRGCCCWPGGPRQAAPAP